MWKYLLLVVIAFVPPTVSWSQDEAEGPAQAQTAPAPGDEPEDAAGAGADEPEDAAGAGADDEALDDLVLEDPELDEQGYEGDDDEFIPTEEIPVDQAIPFPSDI